MDMNHCADFRLIFFRAVQIVIDGQEMLRWEGDSPIQRRRSVRSWFRSPDQVRFRYNPTGAWPGDRDAL